MSLWNNWHFWLNVPSYTYMLMPALTDTQLLTGSDTAWQLTDQTEAVAYLYSEVHVNIMILIHVEFLWTQTNG